MIFTSEQLKQLYAAIDENDIKKIESIIRDAQEDLPPINRLKTSTHFHVACSEGIYELVDFYLSSNQFNINDIELYNGLYFAVARGQIDTVNLILYKYNLDPNYIDDILGSLLGNAAQQEDDKMLKCLLAHAGVHVNLYWQNERLSGWTALMKAMQETPHLNNIRILLEHGANPNPSVVLSSGRTLNYFEILQATSASHPEQKEGRELLRSWQGKSQPKPSVRAIPRLAPHTFQPHEFSAASDFMSRYKARYSEVQALTPFVIACMEGKGFLSIVECYVSNQQLATQELYQAIYLASWFQNHDALKIIFERCDSSLDADTAIKVMNQGQNDFNAYKYQGLHKGKNKRSKNIDAIDSLEKYLSAFEERLSNSGSYSGSESPKHTDSDPEPQSAGSDNSPPRSPPKIAVMPASPPKPLSERAQGLIARFGVDKAVSVSSNIELQKEICDQGLTFTYFDDENKNVFHESVISEEFELAFYILALHRGAVNSKNLDGQTALHLDMLFEKTSYEESSLGIIDFLLKNGADPTLEDRYGHTADYYADQRKFYRCAQLLRDSMVQYTMAHAPAPLLSQPAEINHASPVTPSRSLPTPVAVTTAILTSNTSSAHFRVKPPVAAPAAASSTRSSPSALVVPPQPLSERAKSLIERFGVDQGLSLAYKIELQKEICDQGLTFTYYDKENKNVFHRFVISEKFEIASYILSIYEAVNSTNSDGQTALHLDMLFEKTSYEESSLGIIDFLLKNGADPTLEDMYGHTADYYADQRKFYRCAQLLRDSMVQYTMAHAPAPLLSQPAEINHASPVTPSRSLPTPVAVTTAVLTSNTSSAHFRVKPPVAAPAAASSTHSLPSASINTQSAATGINRGQVISQPPVNTKANKEYKEKQGMFNKLKKLLPGSSSSKSNASRSFSPGVQP